MSQVKTEYTSLQKKKKNANLVEIGLRFETVSVYNHSDAQQWLAAYIGQSGL